MFKQKKYPEALEAIQICFEPSSVHAEHFFLKAQICECLSKFPEMLELLTRLKENNKSANLPDFEIIFERAKKLNEKVADAIPGSNAEFAPGAPDEFYKRYEEWLINSGGTMFRTGIKQFSEDYRGIVAKENIKKGRILVMVPKDLIITMSLVKSSSIAQRIIESGKTLIYPNNSLMAAFVISEQANPDSKWKLFLLALPKSTSSFPVFFTEKEKQLLIGSHFFGIVIKLYY